MLLPAADLPATLASVLSIQAYVRAEQKYQKKPDLTAKHSKYANQNKTARPKSVGLASL